MRPDWREKLQDRLTGFAQNWKGYLGTEQAGAQSFLQNLLDAYEVSFKPGTIFEQHPVKILAKGKRAQVSLFDDGEPTQAFTTERMDMYLPKMCVWEMKSPWETDLQKHHDQLLAYWARMRPRYMVLCNFQEFWIYDTNDDQGQLTPKLTFPLAALPEHAEALLFLRGEAPDLAGRAERVTADVARMLGRLVREAIDQSKEPDRDRERIAKVVLECVFAMFAEDTDLVPTNMFTEVMHRANQAKDMKPVWQLFDDFARKGAADKHNKLAPYVNGPLFDRNQPRVDLSPEHIRVIFKAAHDFDWKDVRPEIFGTIFEQALNPLERHELGAHYTREDDIEKVVGPTVVEPWRERIANLRWPKEAEALIEEMKAFHVLDPACGCGDFLYVVYREMKRLEAALMKKYVTLQSKTAKRRSDLKPPPPGPYFSLAQVHGIELNAFAAFLARVVLWIGEHLAIRELGLDETSLPLKNLEDTIVHGDALLRDWPRPEGELAIVGNPPYLGVRKMRRELGDEYVEEIFQKYPDNRAADLVTYWFTRALDLLRPGERAGFVATKSVGQNESREASLDKIIAKGGTITDAWSNYPWPGEAVVHIAIVNWVMGDWEGLLQLDGAEVSAISPGLTSSGDLSVARRLEANERLCFMGVTPGNEGFVLTDEQRAAILSLDQKSDAVIKPFLVGQDVNRDPRQKPSRWIIDFGMMVKEEADEFPGAMRHVKKHVYSVKQAKNDRKSGAEKQRWWQFVRPRPDMRQAIAPLKRVLVTACVSPHLQISRQPADLCFDHQLIMITLSKPYHFGLLQSAVHSVWAWARGSTLKDDLRYTNTTIFETFPFPPQKDGSYDPKKVPQTPAAEKVSETAEEFERLRADACREHGLGLTKVHNMLEAGELPALAKAYAALNDAVCACYGWPKETWRAEGDMLARLLELNHRLAGE